MRKKNEKTPCFSHKFQRTKLQSIHSIYDYRERTEGATGYALMNDLRTMQMFLRAYNIDPKSWYYKLPVLPRHKKRKVPFPETVYNLCNYKYSKDPYENALYQYLMFHNFFIGWRVPSEPCAMSIRDIDIDDKGRG